jgi:hypothetical protein
MGVGIVVTVWAKPAATELGGRDLFFFGRVQMVLHLPAWAASCGWLTGDDFPGYGGVEGVGVYWDNYQLDHWGTTQCLTIGGLPPGCATEKHGVAVEEFTPYPEPVAHGILHYSSGTVGFLSFANFSAGNKLGILGDLAREDWIAFEIAHRIPHGLPSHLTASFSFSASFNDLSGNWHINSGTIELAEQPVRSVNGSQPPPEGSYDSGSPPLSGSVTYTLSGQLPCKKTISVTSKDSDFQLTFSDQNDKVFNAATIDIDNESGECGWGTSVELTFPKDASVWDPGILSSTVPLNVAWEDRSKPDRNAGTITFRWLYN